VAKTNIITIRTDAETKYAIESLYSSFGITVSDAVNMFFRKSLMEDGLPFDLRLTRYSKETTDAIQEARDIMSGELQTKGYSTLGEMHAAIDAMPDEDC